MKEYRIRIVYMCGGSSCWNTQVRADGFKIEGGAYLFYVGEALIFSSPSNLTIIERITMREDE